MGAGAFLIVAALFVVALVRVTARWLRESALRRQQRRAGAPTPAFPVPEPPTRGFPVVTAHAGDGASWYSVTGVSRVTGEPIELRLETTGPAHAAYKAGLHRVRVVGAVEVGRNDGDGPGPIELEGEHGPTA